MAANKKQSEKQEQKEEEKKVVVKEEKKAKVFSITKTFHGPSYLSPYWGE